MKAIRLHRVGGPEELLYEEVSDPVPKGGEVVVNIEAAGVNFIDIYQRAGDYQISLPATLGLEGAGTISEIGSGVTHLKTGDRVAWMNALGSYAERIAIAADRVVALPATITCKQAAALMVQGVTAHYLAVSTFPLKTNDTCLIHAGAGGVGLLLTQIAKCRGAWVISTVSTPEKAELAWEAGADVVVLYTTEDFKEAVRRHTGGRGVQVVYDSVGAATFARSLDCLEPRGMLVLYGQSSGPAPTVDPQVLSQKGSLFLTRPSLVHHTAAPGELQRRLDDLFKWIANGTLKLRTEFEFPLSDASDSHAALAGRSTTGKVLLIP